jgi:hypothetical protein
VRGVTGSNVVGIRLFHLKGLDVSNEIVDVLLAGRIVNWIQVLETGAPDRHVARAVRGKAAAKFEDRRNRASRIFPFMALCKCGEVRWRGFHYERRWSVSLGGLSMTGSAILQEGFFAGGQVGLALLGFWFGLLTTKGRTKGHNECKRKKKRKT